MIPVSRIPKNMRSEVDEILQDFTEFCAVFFTITDKQGNRVPFVLNPAQLLVAEALIRYRRIIIPKARQLGVSLVLRAWQVYQAVVSDKPLHLACISHHQRSAQHLHALARDLISSLPESLRPPLERETATEIELPKNWGGSSVSCFSAGSSTGTRSYTLSSAHLSEYDYYRDPQGSLAAIEASVGPEGQLIIESTATGPGTHLHQLCTSTSGWHVLFLPWSLDPAYALEGDDPVRPTAGLSEAQTRWWNQKVASLGVDRARLEYPLTLEDCFRPGTGAWLSVPQEVSRTYSDSNSGVLLSENPDPNETYAIGVDPSGGTGGDYAAIVAISKSTGQLAYVWRDNLTTPVQLASKVLDISAKYNDARVLCESNNHGHSVLSTLAQFGFHRYWLDPKTAKPWTTTLQSKLRAFEAMRAWVTNEASYMPEVLALEVASLRLTDSGAPSAPPNMYDDLAMALALACINIRTVAQPVKPVAPTRLAIMALKRKGKL